jgi:NAD(P)-dependent dehydrogenase (short-subunit alcohol dehydrogenase family)
MCNAGIMGLPPATTKDGYELQFGTNHLGHALLIKLLLPIMEHTAARPNSDVRIINMSSFAYQQAPKEGIEFKTLKSDQAKLGGLVPGPQWSRYGQSKLANLLYAKELAKRHPNITTVAIHPGYIYTDLVANVSLFSRLVLMIVVGNKWSPVEEGPYTQTWAATTSKQSLENGAYYEPVGVKTKPTTKQANDDVLAERLWKWTESELEAFR